MAPRAIGTNQQEGEPAASYSLDLSNRSITQSIEQEPLDAEKTKFLEFTVVEVVNPERHPLIFEVHFQEGDREKLLLGSFSLFPPDNPGEFIVATRGQLKSGGKVRLTLLMPEGADPKADIRVDFESIGFRVE